MGPFVRIIVLPMLKSRFPFNLNTGLFTVVMVIFNSCESRPSYVVIVRVSQASKFREHIKNSVPEVKGDESKKKSQTTSNSSTQVFFTKMNSGSSCNPPVLHFK